MEKDGDWGNTDPTYLDEVSVAVGRCLLSVNWP